MGHYKLTAFLAVAFSFPFDSFFSCRHRTVSRYPLPPLPLLHKAHHLLWLLLFPQRLQCCSGLWVQQAEGVHWVLPCTFLLWRGVSLAMTHKSTACTYSTAQQYSSSQSLSDKTDHVTLSPEAFQHTVTHYSEKKVIDLRITDITWATISSWARGAWGWLHDSPQHQSWLYIYRHSQSCAHLHQWPWDCDGCDGMRRHQTSLDVQGPGGSQHPPAWRKHPSTDHKSGVASDSNVLLPVKPVKQNITDKENYTV